MIPPIGDSIPPLRGFRSPIGDLESPLVKIEKLNPKSFLWNDITAPLTDKGDSYGFIAQEVQNDFPFLIKNVGNTNNLSDVLSLDYNSIIALNTAAIKELLAKIEQLEERILELENQ